MASLSGQTLAKIGVPYYLPIGSFDPSGFPIVGSPFIVGGNPYDAYLYADSNIRLSAVSNGTPLASLAMTSNLDLSIPGMTNVAFHVESNLTQLNTTVIMNSSLVNPAFLQVGPADATANYITSLGGLSPGGSNTYIAFNNNGRLYLNGGIVSTPSNFYAESAGPSRVITNGTQITFATGAGDTPITSLSRSGTNFLLSNAGNLQFVGSNFVLDENAITYTASNGFGLDFNPGFGGTTNVLGFKLPGGNTSNSILTDSNSMTVNVAGARNYTLNADTEKLAALNSNVYTTRTPNSMVMTEFGQSWGLTASLTSNRLEGSYSNGTSNGLWMTVSANGNVDFPQGFTVASLSTPSNSSNSIGGITLSNGYLTVPQNISNGGATSNSIGGFTINTGAITGPSNTSNSIGGLSINNGALSNPSTAQSTIGGVLLSNGYMRYASNVWSGWVDSNLRIINRVYNSSPPNPLNNLLGYPAIDPQQYNPTLFNSYTWFKLWLPTEIFVDSGGACSLYFDIASKVQSPTAGNGNYLWQSNISTGSGFGGQIVRWGPTTYWTVPTSNIDNTSGSNSTYAFGTLFPIVVHKDVFPIYITGYQADPPNAQTNYRVYNGSSGGSAGNGGDLPLMLEGWY